ncbi:MAG: hypothetical protein WBE83_09955, partial [Candidatus Cybelea sp.]
VKTRRSTGVGIGRGAGVASRRIVRTRTSERLSRAAVERTGDAGINPATTSCAAMESAIATAKRRELAAPKTTPSQSCGKGSALR